MKVDFLNFEKFHAPIRSEMIDVFKHVYDSNWFVMGEQLKTFEKKYSKFSNTKYAIGVSNGLDAIFLSLKCLGVEKGDEVIIPSNTYIATALAVSYTGATPVFVEPDNKTYNLSAHNFEKNITPNTKVVIPVHLYGQSCEMDKICSIAKKNGIYVVEDNAQAHGAKFKDKITGSWGDVNATSFYPGKNLGALGDGGAITTDDPEYAEMLFALRNYGSKIKYENIYIGYNKRLDEVHAAFLNVKMKYLVEWTKERREIAFKYNNELKGVGDIVLPFVHPDSFHVYHLYVIRTKFRDKLKNYLKSKNIDTLIHYPIPPHLQKAYESLNLKEGSFPIAERLSKEVISLPIWPGMNNDMIATVANEIKNFFNHEYV